MAKEDASVAIQNALQKLDQQPSLLHSVEKLQSVKSKLHRLGSNLKRFNSISTLTQVREIAYDVEDAMDDAIMVAAAEENTAHQRWRKLGNLFLFLSGADKSHQTNQQLVEEHIEDIHKRTASIDSSIIDEDAVVGEPDDVAEIPPEKDEHRLVRFFLSLSGFPADVEIHARQLIQIWVAEGFLDWQGSRGMEEQGRDQINRLLKSGFITQAQTGTDGNLKTFKIGQDVLGRCISEAEKEEFLHVKFNCAGGSKEETGKLKATRLAIHNQSLLAGGNLKSFADLSKVRSLQIHCDISNNRSPSVLDYGFLKPRKKEFHLLRVLDLGSLELETVPKAIGKLTRLRYLRLRAPEAAKIPSSICNLPNLQTIDLKETKRVKTMPVEIWKMKKNLRHLHLGGATALPPPHRTHHYNALEKLQTLCGVRPDRELKRLMVRAKFPNVNRLKLHMSKKDSATNKEEFLSFLNSLDLLYHLRSLTLRGPVEDLPPDWNAFPSSLTKMTLLKTRIPAEKCVESLQNLPNLRCLKLMEESIKGAKMKCGGGGFPALQVMRMKGVKEVKSWMVEKGAMRLLRDLVVTDCKDLITVEAVQPSEELREALKQLKKQPEMSVEVVITCAESNGAAS